MQKGLTVLLLLALALSCRAQVPDAPPLPSWSDSTQKDWWDKNPSPDLWPKASDALLAQLEANYKQNGSTCFSDPDFRGWLEHLQWIRLGVDCPSVLADAASLKTFIALGQDEAVSHLFVEKLDPRDVKETALKNVLRLSQDNAADLHEYAALGVAFSLVFDQPFPGFWPHPQVKQDAVPLGDIDVVPRFHFYVQANRDKKTEQDLTQLSFENLRFLVDSEVSLSELEYAQQNRTSYSSFADTFFSIKYDTPRNDETNTQMVWPHPTYTLKDIEKYGGICVDQAYYATIIGKGRGIPTVYFQGQGGNGGHAWFGYLSRSGKWELDCGRYESQNYPRGYARDPQTWMTVDDTMLTYYFKTESVDPHLQQARTALSWAQLNAVDPVICKKILDDARSIMPELVQTWLMESALLENTNASVDDKKVFYQDWITQFSSFPDMKVQGQQRLAVTLKATDEAGSDSVKEDIAAQNRRANFDVGIRAAYGTIFEKIGTGDWDSARAEYEKTIREFSDKGGGTLYYGIVVPYVQACLKSGQVDQAERGLKLAEDRMSFDSASLLGKDFKDLKDKVAAQMKAAEPAQ
jgi:hypothetical protein